MNTMHFKRYLSGLIMNVITNYHLLSATFIILAVFACVQPLYASVTFDAAVNYGVGTGPRSVTTGDFDKDGDSDLAVANYNSNNVSVLLGNGNGTLQAAVNYGTGTGPRSITTGDFNKDGNIDLAVAYSVFAGNVSILLGNGDGTFQAAVSYGAGLRPYSVTTGDFNKDGNTDLAVANNSGSNISVLLGNGDGTFQGAVNYGAGLFPYSLCAGDFNNDGNTDLAVANNGGGNVSVLLGNGNGTFQVAVNFAAGTAPASAIAGDFDKDGDTDIAIANNGDSNVSVLIGNGDGTFQAAVNYSTGTAPYSVITGDFDKDGNTDFAAANFSSNDVSVLIGNGNGTFQSAVNFGAGNNPYFVITGDFDKDGDTDLSIANNGNNNISILLNTTPVLIITKIGTGSGQVTSAPAGINCGTDCAEGYPAGTVVTLTATADTNSTFTGWSGDADYPDGQVTMNSSKTCTATFTLQYLLTVTRAGTGNGTVTATGINCGTDCTEACNPGAVITLTAVADANSVFTGWSGGSCSGTGICSFNINADTAITAVFAAKQYSLTVTRAGTGNGTVTATGINCGTDCTEVYNSGTTVILTAAPYPMSGFSGWSGGGCTGTGQCVVTINSPVSVTATFNIVPSVTIIASVKGNGTISPSGEVIVPFGAGKTFIISPSAGISIADVFIDGVSVGPVESYTFSNMTDNHRIEAIFGNVIDNTDPAINYKGGWHPESIPNSYRSSILMGHNIGGKTAELKLVFTGNGISWRAMTGPNGGSAKVYIDGELKGRVILRNSETRFDQEVFRYLFAYGTHTILIAAEPALPGIAINVDRFIIE